MRKSSRATTWCCGGCGVELVRTDTDQESPPEGWRVIHLLPLSLNLALEPFSPRDVKRNILCGPCFAAPVILWDVFSGDG